MRIDRFSLEDQVYNMFGNLNKTTKKKDIGVVIDDKFSDHLTEKVSKTNRIVGVIKRTFVHLDQIFKALYITLMRPYYR